MNLAKFLNKKFFLQNLKKSRGFIILIFFIMLILNSLHIVYLLYMCKNKSVDIELEDISVVTNYGMYIVPIILSILLFEMIYKKKSVDFINSMPITRKTFFLSNNIGGIVLIIFLIIINAAVIFLIGNYDEIINISLKMILRYVAVWSAMYICVFEITNLAMSIVGNKITQIALTMVIFFMGQFLYVYCRNITHEKGNNSFYINQDQVYLQTDNKDYISDNAICTKDGYKIDAFHYEEYRVASPMFIFAGVNCTEYIVDESIGFSIACILIVICFILGYRFYQRKEMENCETSFKNMHIHSILKSLTLFPFLVFVMKMYFESNWRGWSIFLFYMAICVVYYIIYDLITIKKVLRWKMFVGYFLITCIVSAGTIKLFYSLPKFKENVIKEKEIEKINLCNGNAYGEVFADEEIKQILLKELTDLERISKVDEVDTTLECLDVTLILKDKNKIGVNVWLDKNEMNIISNYIKEHVDIDSMKKWFKKADNILIDGINELDENDYKEILYLINNNLDSFYKENIKLFYSNVGVGNLYTYESLEKKIGYLPINLTYYGGIERTFAGEKILHSVIPIVMSNDVVGFDTYIYPVFNKELYKMMFKLYNKNAEKDKENFYKDLCYEESGEEYLVESDNSEYAYKVNCLMGKSSKSKMDYTKAYTDYITFLYKNCHKEFENYIGLNYKEEFLLDKSYMAFEFSHSIDAASDNGVYEEKMIDMIFFTNDVGGIKKLIELCQNKVVTKKDYKESYNKVYNEIISKLDEGDD